MRSLPRFVLARLVAGGLLIGARAADAKSTPEQTCQKGSYSAAAQYGACQHKALAKFFGRGNLAKSLAASGKCQTKYMAVWPKLQAKARGSTCTLARLTADATTVTDNLTGVQWEKKTDDATIHDKDNLYSWSAALPITAANGTAFTTFLSALNSGGCFAEQCDWRLPTIYELQTILLAPNPCATSPCIDPAFGPTVADYYWSATTFATFPAVAFDVYFGTGFVNYAKHVETNYVRAVRAGL